jgi:glycosyltransferase involved in cell wall biosynthesis
MMYICAVPRIAGVCAPISAEMSDSENLSLSIFFPAYNDAESLPELIKRTFEVIPRLTSNYEVLVINDGSTDNTAQALKTLAEFYTPRLKIITHQANRGYGAALRTGFAACTKDLVFYTDGDGQYDVREIEQLWKRMRPGVDLVNGYKLNRADAGVRILIGNVYNWAVRRLFHIRIRDVDCDFRLIRRSVLDRIELQSDTGSICVELAKKLQNMSGRFEEVGVRHCPRMHGRSQFFRPKAVLRTFYQLLSLYRALDRSRAR